jgi:hypothetical protein
MKANFKMINWRPYRKAPGLLPVAGCGGINNNSNKATTGEIKNSYNSGRFAGK